MDFIKFCVTVIVCVFLMASLGESWRKRSRRIKRNHVTCRARSLVRYQMTVKTMWDKDTFPKMYPTYRPPAHWSQLIGRSHGGQYRMWREGSNASLAVGKFAEDESTELFDLELSQGYNGVLDAFVAPVIKQGSGKTSAVFSVDAGHSKVSFMMAMIPSPDWFIGLDSVDLCYRGRWKRKLQRDLRPFDAGTDQGLTFTAPRWPTDPQEPISAITSSSPDHPASSFFYPEYDVLPPLARVEFEIVAEYRLKKVHKEVTAPEMNHSKIDRASSDRTDAILEQLRNDEPVQPNPVSGKVEKSLIESMIHAPRGNTEDDTMSPEGVVFKKKTRKTPKPEIQSFVAVDTKRVTPSQKHSFRHNSRNDVKPTTTTSSSSGSEMKKMELSTTRGSSSPSPQGNEKIDSGEPYDEPTEKMSAGSLKEPQFAEISTRFSHTEQSDYTGRSDCLVSEWSEWSPCSQTCGFGTKRRSRDVLELPRQGGQACPLLREETLCGSMRNCKWNHFSFMGGHGKPKFRTVKRSRTRRRRKFLFN